VIHDVFLSYHTRDHAQVLALAEQLRGQTLRVFLDRWYLTPGLPWPQALEQALSACGAVAVCIGPGGIGSWQQREINLALERQAKDPGFPVIPVLLPGAEPPLGFLSQNTWVDFRSGPIQDLPLAILAAAVRGEPPDALLRERVRETLDSVCPYKGLQFFREEDAAFFFGRDSAVAMLYQAVQQRRFIALVGPSGNGKSSVVRAGLLPKLRRDSQAPWEILAIVPGDRPFQRLAAGLLPLLEPDLGENDRLIATAKQAQALADGVIQIRDVVERVLEKQAGTQRCLLVVDQWEELYTQASEDGKTSEVATRFIDQLLQATQAGKLSVLLTLRADFMGHALAHRPLSDRLQGGQVNLGPMNAEELRLAVTQPAAALGVGFEQGLAQRIIDAVDGQPGHLPLVEFVLQKLWQARQGGGLRHRDYEELGELEGAIAHTANTVYQGLPAADQARAEKLFLQLVQVGETQAPTRRRAKLAEMDAATRKILLGLADARLLVTDADTVEVAHEALIRHWQVLQAWLDRDREFLLWRRRLQEAMEAWDKARRDGAALLSGSRLTEAARWLKKRGGDLNGQEAGFIRLGLRRRLKNRSFAAGLAALLMLGAGITSYVDQERITWRAGFYVWLGKAGIYYLQPEMVAIPGGSFLMGAADAEKDVQDNERPQHRVTIRPFQMGKYEVTFDEYDVFTRLIEDDGGCDGGHKINVHVGDQGWGRGRQPAINVSWDDAVCYAQWLSKKTGKLYRLPTEAEWEYAARAGTVTAYWWGDEPGVNRANFNGSGSPWSGQQTAPVGSFPANAFGLHDTAGNVWEWVQDRWHDSYQGAPVDGSAWEAEPPIIRGGSWNSRSGDARCAVRYGSHPNGRNGGLGFRLCCGVFPGAF